MPEIPDWVAESAKPIYYKCRAAQIDMAIEFAIKMESKLTPLALSIPMLGSLKIRHLLNNLGSISACFLDVGSHVGGSYCSTVHKNDNLKYSAVVDSWASDNDERCCFDEFRENVLLCKPIELELLVEKSDCFKVDLTQFRHKFDLYSYDASHGRIDQKNALIYYKPVLEDIFIYCCDDWAYGDVKAGTMEGIEQGGYDILHQRELMNETPGDEHLNNEWWRSYAVFLLKKKS